MNTALNRFADWFQRHWLAALCGFLLIYSTLPLLAPVLKAAGAERMAQLIYVPYKAACHTYGFRSFYLFGDKFAYSRSEFDARSGIDTSNSFGVIAARNFQGNAEMGYKVAICERDMAIYPSIALGGIVFALLRRRVKGMPWWLFVLIGVGPIGLDGFSQLLSQLPPPYDILPYRESVWQLRVLTGALFGFSVAWLVFPMIQSQATLSNPQ